MLHFRLESALQQGQLEKAKGICLAVLKMCPTNADALHLLGVIEHQVGNNQRAVELIKKAITIDSKKPAFYSDLGNALQELRQYEAAIASFDQAIYMGSGHAEIHFSRGKALQCAKRYDAAIASYDRAICLRLDYAEAYSNRGVALKELKQYVAAISSYDQAICIKSDFADVYYNRGNALQALKQYDAAIASYDRAIHLRFEHAEVYFNRGNALLEFRQYEAAATNYSLAICIRSDYAEVYFNRGNALHGIKRYEAAITSYDRAICLRSDYAEAYSNRGVALKELKQYVAAISSYDQAICIKSDFADAYYNRGNALQALKHYDAAIASYGRAIYLGFEHAEVYLNRGNVLLELGQYEVAVTNFSSAICIRSDYAKVYFNRGNALTELKQYEAAVASYDRAICITHDFPFADGYRLQSKMFICRWNEFDKELGGLVSKIQKGEKTSAPFQVLALIDSPNAQRQAASIFVREQYPTNSTLGRIPSPPKRQVIRIGYYSADFHNHATTHLMAELFERHDKAKFELFAFSFGPHRQDEMRQRVMAAVDYFVDVRHQSDKSVAQLSRDVAIDIAIDLKGFTQEGRTGVFSYRAAPIQVNYLGYPGTMAAEYIDYLIADRTLIPEKSQKHYSEKIVYLPHSYQANDTKKMIADKQFSREELGLPNDGFVFCCFNNTYKITPIIFDCWMRIMQRIEGSVLWLLEDNPIAAINLGKEAEQRGVNRDRLIFAKRAPLAEHLARHRVADLFLDTLPYNAHTTASDALWAGVPLITCTGESFASRVAASLLNAIDLPELITTVLEDYEALAIELATNALRLQMIKQELDRKRLTTPLFDISLFTRHIEDAYLQMYKRYHANLPPEHIYVSYEKS